MAAHPQQEANAGPAGVIEPEPEGLAAKNPFPTSMTVPGPGGQDATIELAVVGGVVYAPMLEELPLDPAVRQYVTQYCAAWTSSVVTSGRVPEWPEPPRRAQVILRESQLHAMLGLAGDERLVRVVYDEVTSAVRFVLESPRLPQQPYWDGGPPVITLPIAAHYESAQ